jgi:hypothetical protein
MASLSNFLSSFRSDSNREIGATNSSTKTDGAGGGGTAPGSATPSWIVLVIDAGKQKANWVDIFHGCIVNDKPIRVFQAAWQDIHVSGKAHIHISTHKEKLQR